MSDAGHTGCARAGAAALLLALVTACATSYQDPDPGALPTVRVVVRNPHADDPLGGLASTILDVYALDGACDPSARDLRDAYQGTLDLDQVEREFRVVAGRHVFFALSYAEHAYKWRSADEVSCRGSFGFLPQAGEDYSLELHLSRHHECDVELRRAGEVVPLLHPSECFASGW